jgi:hypothetical protein
VPDGEYTEYRSRMAREIPAACRTAIQSATRKNTASEAGVMFEAILV